jgi:hypothetical protein
LLFLQFVAVPSWYRLRSAATEVLQKDKQNYENGVWKITHIAQVPWTKDNDINMLCYEFLSEI